VSSAVGVDGTLKIAAAKLYDGHVPCAIARYTSPLTAWKWRALLLAAPFLTFFAGGCPAVARKCRCVQGAKKIALLWKALCCGAWSRGGGCRHSFAAIVGEAAVAVISMRDVL
jgi:hypothetical protein